MSKTKTLKLDDITIDGDTQSRVKINESVVKDYAEHIREGCTLPPVDVCHDGSTYWLWDGFHRLLGHQDAGVLEIECNVTRGTQQDAQWLSYAANKSHGLRRTNDDKKKSVLNALKHPKGAEMSDEMVAEHVGVSRQTVLRYRNDLKAAGCQNVTTSASRKGKDGKVYPVKNQPAKLVQVEKSESKPDDLGWDDDEEEQDVDPATSFYEGEPTPEPWKCPTPKEAAKPIDLAVRQLNEWEQSVLESVIKSDEPGTAFFDERTRSNFQAIVENLRGMLKTARPHAVCPLCKGERCKECRDSGLVPKRLHEMLSARASA